MGIRLLVAVNYAPNQSQCYVHCLPRAQERAPAGETMRYAARQWQLKDVMGEATYRRDSKRPGSLAGCFWTCRRGAITSLSCPRPEHVSASIERVGIRASLARALDRVAVDPADPTVEARWPLDANQDPPIS